MTAGRSRPSRCPQGGPCRRYGKPCACPPRRFKRYVVSPVRGLCGVVCVDTAHLVPRARRGRGTGRPRAAGWVVPVGDRQCGARWPADMRRPAEHVGSSAAVCCATAAVGFDWRGGGVGGRAGVPGLCGVAECLGRAVGTLCARFRGCLPYSARCGGVRPAQTGRPLSVIALSSDVR